MGGLAASSNALTMRTKKTFYRYRCFDHNTLDLLCHDKLHFANPSTFNDPLDCKPILKPDAALEDLRGLLSHLVTRRVRTEILDLLAQARVHGEKAEIHAQRHAELEAARVVAEIADKATDPEYTVTEEQAETCLLTHSVHQELACHYERGVCCFSSTYSNPLLWSHYGDQHRGLCIGYDLVRKPRPALFKVIYGGNRFIKTSTLVAALVKGDKDAQGSLDRDMLLRKAQDWSYEHEWRLIGKQGVQDSPLRLKEVTFGLRCPDSVMHTIMQALRAPGRPIDFFQIYEIHGSYRLARRKPGPEEMDGYFPRVAQSGKEIFGSLIGDVRSPEAAASAFYRKA
jgi:Protein of unknown function (DUF2971)